MAGAAGAHGARAHTAVGGTGWRLSVRPWLRPTHPRSPLSTHPATMSFIHFACLAAFIGSVSAVTVRNFVFCPGGARASVFGAQSHHLSPSTADLWME